MMKCQAAVEGQRFLLCFVAIASKKQEERETAGNFWRETPPTKSKASKNKRDIKSNNEEAHKTNKEARAERNSGTWDNHQFNDKRQRSQAAQQRRVPFRPPKNRQK